MTTSLFTPVLGVYRRSRFNEELIPAAESPAVISPSDMRVDMAPSPEALGGFLDYICSQTQLILLT